MKKAKVLLTAIGIFAIVGGTLAFKANRNASVFCSTTFSTICTSVLTSFTIAPNVQLIKGYCTDIEDAPCPLTNLRAQI